MKKITIGITAHVDAGKTTLSEALLFSSGAIRTSGRVDAGTTVMDNNNLEKDRGITIFSNVAQFKAGDFSVSLVDTPGHVDFMLDTERVLRVLDAAILVISGIDGVQSHTKTLFRLLKHYNIPVFIFVTKTDLNRTDKKDITEDLKKQLSEFCIDFGDDNSPDFYENVAVADDNLTERFLSGKQISTEEIKQLIFSGKIYPCFFGSGLKNTGISEFISGLSKYLTEPVRSTAELSATVFKSQRDTKNNLTHYLKINSGRLKVRDKISVNGKEDIITSLKIFEGSKQIPADEAEPGEVCAITGPSEIYPGYVIGNDKFNNAENYTPVIKYNLILPSGEDAGKLFIKLKTLESEEPGLNFDFNSKSKIINVSVLGEIQAQILCSIIKQRFDVETKTGAPEIIYKETVKSTVEGVGHYEPLKHYAEVHILIEPAPVGSGISYESRVSEDLLDKNWQRLILTHLQEKKHAGILTGSELTDVKFILAAGKAHLKHTEGGDFRQAVYRAVRQGLMQSDSKLLEPFYSFELEIPSSKISRAVNDLKIRRAEYKSPEILNDKTVIKGICPVAEMNSYFSEVAAYTSGEGKLFIDFAGYFECGNSKEIIEKIGYNPETDLDNTADSVFCAHGAGFAVKWDKVPEYMHIESCLKQKKSDNPVIRTRNFHIDDKELEKILEREFGSPSTRYYKDTKQQKISQKVEEVNLIPRKNFVIIDGYNVIFAWEDLKILAEHSLEDARDRLIQRLCNYASFTGYEVVLVFDAYKIKGGIRKSEKYKSINIVYTAENELCDVYIQKFAAETGKNDKVRIVSSDRLIQMSALEYGVLRVDSAAFEQEIEDTEKRIEALIENRT